ncbi:hypothetical protein OX90_09715 [Pseudomonas coronafaciens pv. porri]|uniref:Uncharacterized protein n=1 Tax=Pseudomonas coronafaciens pv. porri TaxID=83964 RepID=A0ABR5JQX3_9PSED|nr:hypothetical protein [Pseudomonas coronafaciens]KOP51410.1 hypothetical protein OX88_25645 [Pseudomonas coronafaciens pv. porri]KOP59788.1 hypothetical protein OX90_09715 [Pseudomonas coronafaciens pv. porri]KPY19431.1 Uncharacterized protein ALO89_02106 [Pseudomonas coronafaciens pv. porri]RMU81895.1 hypothetical protein ALP22_04007 [Pseudomonas coronafaciens pv. porri]RMW02028.1 hypothetical protein ALO99_02383 [Pseudomonas coronafaciens pv. porri]
MIDNVSVTHLTSSTITTVAKSAPLMTRSTDLKEPAATTQTDSAGFSTLSRQLSSTAARADARDSSLSFKDLRALAETINDKIAGTSYRANRTLHDAEIPDTDDSARLERARQATQFRNGLGTNTFASLSQDELRLIMYDESGDFTINERSAASSENHLQQEAWNRAMGKRYVDEYNETGESTQTLVMLLAHYDQLPPIEKAQYPANYAATITSGDSSAMGIFSALKNQSGIQQT